MSCAKYIDFWSMSEASGRGNVLEVLNFFFIFVITEYKQLLFSDLKLGGVLIKKHINIILIKVFICGC